MSSTSTRRPNRHAAASPRTEALRARLDAPYRDEDLDETVAAALDTGIQRIELRFLIGIPGETVEDAEAIATRIRSCHRIRKRRAQGRGRLHAVISCFTPQPHTALERRGMMPRM